MKGRSIRIDSVIVSEPDREYVGASGSKEKKV